MCATMYLWGMKVFFFWGTSTNSRNNMVDWALLATYLQGPSITSARQVYIQTPAARLVSSQNADARQTRRENDREGRRSRGEKTAGGDWGRGLCPKKVDVRRGRRWLGSGESRAEQQHTEKKEGTRWRPSRRWHVRLALCMARTYRQHECCWMRGRPRHIQRR